MGRYRYATRQPRGRIVGPFAPAPLVVLLPVPQFLSTRRPRLLRVSRGRVSTAPAQLGQVPFVVLSRARRQLWRRTSRVFSPPFLPAAVAPPMIPQFSGRRQPQLLRLRRSTITQFTYPGAAPQFLAAMPQFTGRRQPPLLRVRRTSVQQFLFPGASPVVIPPLPITVSRRRAPLLRLRRSIISSRIAAPLNTGTGPLVPNMLRRHMWRTRMWRSQQFSPHLIGAAAPPITPTFPVPPNMTGGLSGLSLGKRAFRRRHRPVKWQLDHSQVWRRFE